MHHFLVKDKIKLYFFKSFKKKFLIFLKKFLRILEFQLTIFAFSFPRRKALNLGILELNFIFARLKNQSFNKSCKIVLNLLTFNIGKLNNI